MGYKIAAICKNGHDISSYLDSIVPDEKFCSTCGSEVITTCQECNTPIRGKHVEPHIIDCTPYHVPAYCYACGAPFPWTQAALDAAKEVILEEDAMDEGQREKLIASIPDILTETPKTQVATVRFKKALATAGKFTAEALRQFVIDFGCELAKKQMGL